MAMVFPAKSILRVDGEFLSEHSRSPLDVSFEQIEFAKRTVNGHMRVYEVAKKHNLGVSWTWIPSRAIYTVDGYLGGKDMYEMYLAGGEVRVEVWADKYAAKTEPFAMIDFSGRFKDFNFSVEKRNLGGIFYDYWNVSMSIEEL